MMQSIEMGMMDRVKRMIRPTGGSLDHDITDNERGVLVGMYIETMGLWGADNVLPEDVKGIKYHMLLADIKRLHDDPEFMEIINRFAKEEIILTAASME